MRLRLAGFAVAILVVLVGAPSPVAAASTATGRLYAFGDNYWGQLGSTTNNQAEAANPTPTVVTLPGATGPVTQVAAGSDDSFAVTSTGQLYAFGNNDYGQLGSATNNGTSNANPTPTPVTLPGATGPVTQIAAGFGHSLAVTSTGQLYAFGNNVSGQLGSATNSGNETANPTPAPVGLPAGTTISTVARGPEASQTLALEAPSAAIPPTISPAFPICAVSTGGFPGCPGLSVLPPPGLTAVSLTNKRFRVAKQSTAISSKKTPLGTTFRFTLGAPAKLQITITRSAPGLRHGRGCLAPTGKLRRKHAKRCTRTLTVGTLTRASEPKGADSIAFSGRLGHRALSPQPYKAVLGASDAAGRSVPVTLAFVVVPASK
jgi:hypothetical protein